MSRFRSIGAATLLVGLVLASQASAATIPASRDRAQAGTARSARGAEHTALASGVPSSTIAALRYEYDGADRETARQDVHRAGRTQRVAYDDASRVIAFDADLVPTFQGDATNRAAWTPFTPAQAAPVAFRQGRYGRRLAYDAQGLDHLDNAATLTATRAPAGQAFATGSLFPSTLGFVNQVALSDQEARMVPECDLTARRRFPGSRRVSGRGVQTAPRAHHPLFATGSLFPSTLGFVTQTQAGARLRSDRGLAAFAPSVLGGTLTLEHDPRGRLTRVIRSDGRTVTYTYRPDGVLLARDLTCPGAAPGCQPRSTTFIYDGLRLLEQRDDSGLSFRFLYADDLDVPFAVERTGRLAGLTERAYFVHDRNGSPLGLLDPTGHWLEHVTHDLWGWPTYATPDTAPPEVDRLARDGRHVVVEFTEPILPAVEPGPRPGTRLRGLQPLDDAFTLVDTSTGGDVPVVARLRDRAPGHELVLTTRSPLVVGRTYQLRALAGRVTDGHGNAVDHTQPLANFTWTAANGTLVQRGLGPQATAPGVVPTSPFGHLLGFQSHLVDPDLGLIHMRGRVFDPHTGTFLELDPAGLVDSTNPYAGFAHDTVNLRDPTGLLSGNDDGTTERHLALRDPMLAAYGIGFGVAGTATVLSGGAILVAGETMGVMGGISAALGLSGGLAGLAVALTSLASGHPEAIEQASIPIMYGSGVGPLLGGTLLMTLNPDDAQAGWMRGVLIGGGLEATVSLGVVAGHASRAMISHRASVGLGTSTIRAAAGKKTPSFDIAKLRRIEKALAKRGITVSASNRNIRRLKEENAGAMLVLGTREAVFKARPSRIQVLEELIHVGQARRAGWPRTISFQTEQVWDIAAKTRILKLKNTALIEEEIFQLSASRSIADMKLKVYLNFGHRIDDNDAVDLILEATKDD